MKKAVIATAFLLIALLICAGTPYTYSGASFTCTSAADITDTTATEVCAALSTDSPNKYFYITAFTVSNMDASVDTRVDLLTGASTVKWHCPAAHGGGGCTVSFPEPIKVSAQSAINCQCATNSAEVRCSVKGYSSNT